MGKDVNKRLRALEERVRELEAQPQPIIQLVPYIPWVPYVVPYWQIPIITTTVTCDMGEPVYIDARTGLT